MTVYQILLTIQYLSVALLIFMCAHIIKKWTKPTHAWLFFYSMATLVNAAGYLALLHAQTQREAMLIWQFIYLCRAWVPFTLLVFVLHLCNCKNFNKITTALAYFHIFIYLNVLTMAYNPLYYKNFGFTHEGLFPHFTYTPGILHYIYDSVCICYIIVGMRLLFRSSLHEKNSNKKIQYIFITIAILMVCLFYILQLFRIVPGYDLNALGFTVAAIIFHIGFFRFDILDSKNLSEAVVVFDQPKVQEEEHKAKIEAFGDSDSRLKIPFNEILYFEADSDQVFVYTAAEIFKVKQRLYQVEELAQSAGIMRVSKSHLINVKKIESVRPALNSRLYVKMQNGEEVLVSRKYVHDLKAAII